MVHAADAAGGSQRLAELTDRYGKAIEADFIRFYGQDIGDYLWGRKKPSQAMRLVDMLPANSATRAQMVTAPRTGGSSSRKAPAWREVYDRQVKDVLMDLWELTAQINSGKKKARRVTYPDPTRKR